MTEEHLRAKPVTLCALIGRVFIGLPMATVFILVLSPFSLLALAYEWLSDRWEARKARRDPFEPVRPSVLMEWVRAKKRKVCPLVEFD